MAKQISELNITAIDLSNNIDIIYRIQKNTNSIVSYYGDYAGSHISSDDLNKIEKNLSQLLNAEIDSKTNSKLSSILCERSILTICHEGKQHFQN